MTTFLLYESASGYALFELSGGVDEVQTVAKDSQDLQRFGKVVKLVAFKPFTSAANALEQINGISEAQVRLKTAQCYTHSV